MALPQKPATSIKASHSKLNLTILLQHNKLNKLNKIKDNIIFDFDENDKIQQRC